MINLLSHEFKNCTLFAKESRNSGYSDLRPDPQTLPGLLCALCLSRHLEVFRGGFPHLPQCHPASHTWHRSAPYVEAAVCRSPGGSQA